MDDIKIALLTIFHPLDSFTIIKRQREQYKHLTVLTILALLVFTRIAYIYFVHFPLVDVLPMDANIWLEVLKTIVPIITWTISIYGVTTILNGEMKLGESMVANAYCLIPSIVFSVPIIALSNILSINERGIFEGLQTVVTIWVLVLLFLNVMHMNNYSFLKTIWVCFLGLCTMILIWCVCLLIGALTIQFFSFIGTLIDEYKISYLK